MDKRDRDGLSPPVNPLTFTEAWTLDRQSDVHNKDAGVLASYFDLVPMWFSCMFVPMGGMIRL